VVGLLFLPPLLTGWASDDVIVVMATGGEWLRLNGTSAACFGRTTAGDSGCRYLERSHCEAASCVWANPSELMCGKGAGDPLPDSGASCATSWGRCGGLGCAWRRPLDLRAKCLELPPTASFGGPRCDGILQNKPGAIAAVRAEVQMLLTQLITFLLGNYWLVLKFGGIDELVTQGKHYVMALFAAITLGGYVRLRHQQ
jgi:hypothetical protein